MLADLRSDGHEALMHLRSKVSSDGRIVVPRTVGKRLNPGPDDYVHSLSKQGAFVFCGNTAGRERSIRNFLGMGEQGR
jgi:hypothetical protein